MTSTEGCSAMNESQVSLVRKCTLPDSLLQSGGGGGGAGFWGLRKRLANLKQFLNRYNYSPSKISQ